MDLAISIHRIRKAYKVLAIQGDLKGFKAKPWNTNHWWLNTTIIYGKDNSHLCIQVLHLTSITPRKPSHSSPEKSSPKVAWLERKVKQNEKVRQSKSSVYFLLREILQVFNEKHPSSYPSVSLLIYKLPKRCIQRYKRKYIGWLQGETRKLHKIS